MVLFLLYIKAELDGIQEIQLKGDANLSVSVRNPLSDWETREKVVFNASEFIEQEEGARQNPHHFSIKWEGNKKACTLEVLDAAAAKAALKKKKSKDGGPRFVTDEDSGNWVPILAMECRGLEPYAFHPMGDEFIVTSTGGASFAEDVDFSEGDWGDYDEENDGAVSANEVEFKIESV